MKMKAKAYRISLYLLAAILLVAGTAWATIKSIPKAEQRAEPVLNAVSCNATASYIPDTLMFAGEPVPVHLSDVKESLDRELLTNAYWHSQTILMMKRANRFFPIMEPILKEQGIPTDFKYLAVIESGLLNTASSAGARGFWQIMEATGKEHGLEINEEVDERLNLEKSTLVACKYLKIAHRKFGNWAMVAASYNMGIGGLNNSSENQGATSFYDLWLNTETARYVYRIIAMKLLMENPLRYNIALSQSDLYPVLETRDTTTGASRLSVADLAKQLGLSYKTLKIFNPWLVSTSFSNKEKKTYTFKIPAGNYREQTFGLGEKQN